MTFDGTSIDKAEGATVDFEALKEHHGEDAVKEAFMLGVIQGLKQAKEWRPIETAPKDGTRVLLLGRGMRHADGHWESKAYNGNGCWVWPYVKAEPRNWMPLPPPPQEQ